MDQKKNKVTTETSSNLTDDQDSTIGNIIQKEDLNQLSTPVRKWTKKNKVTTNKVTTY